MAVSRKTCCKQYVRQKNPFDKNTTSNPSVPLAMIFFFVCVYGYSLSYKARAFTWMSAILFTADDQPTPLLRLLATQGPTDWPVHGISGQ